MSINKLSTLQSICTKMYCRYLIVIFFKSLIFGVISSPNIKYPLLIFFSFNIFCLNQALEKKLET